MQFLDDLVHKYKVMPEGVTDANAVGSAFFSGRAAMIVNSTGALGFVRDNMKQPYRVAFIPRAIRNAVPIGGGSLLIPKGNTPERQHAAWTFINEMTSPAVAGGWSRFTGYFAPNRHAYELPEMQATWPSTRTRRSRWTSCNTPSPGSPPTPPSPCARRWRTRCRPCCPAAPSRPRPWPTRRRRRTTLLRPYAEKTALDLPQ